MGKEDPFLTIGDENDRTKLSDSDYVWALKDINFDVNQGEVIGIIGRNGAGKSTLLKILSRTTGPTQGSLKIKGRIASLLEVGTGFHGELSGKENIFLNGAIMGLRKHEIKRKLDEIIDFAGVERYIDTPVKRYSSGMYIRLAFAVAAHLEPEILIVDEVLAVGDAEFQKKCLGKMKDVSGVGGRTVLFVSHNMAAVKELCDRSIFLKNGRVYKSGLTNDIVRDYLLNPVTISSADDLLNDTLSRRGNGEARFTKIKINNGDVFLDPQRDINIELTANINKTIEGLHFTFLVKSPENSEALTSTGIIQLTKDVLTAGSQIKFSLTVPGNTFRTGLFPTYFWLGRKVDIGDNYPYDLVDSVYYLNFTSDKSREELGYNSLQPGGYFNIQSEINNLQIIENAFK
jgi:lipopolysaccharide transport system ATP-binding protein